MYNFIMFVFYSQYSNLLYVKLYSVCFCLVQSLNSAFIFHIFTLGKFIPFKKCVMDT